MKTEIVYTAADGDTLRGVAEKLNTTAANIRAHNDGAGDTLRAGEKLFVPNLGLRVYTVGLMETAEGAAARLGAEVSELLALNRVDKLFPGQKILAPLREFERENGNDRRGFNQKDP